MRTGDSFAVHPMRLTADDEQWLRLASANSDAFAADIDRWTVSTPASRIRGQAARFVRAIRINMEGLKAVRWPAIIGRSSRS